MSILSTNKMDGQLVCKTGQCAFNITYLILFSLVYLFIVLIRNIYLTYIVRFIREICFDYRIYLFVYIEMFKRRSWLLFIDLPRSHIGIVITSLMLHYTVDLFYCATVTMAAYLANF